MSPKKRIQIKSRVREYCDRKTIDKNQFIALCLSSRLTTETGRTLTVDTVTRIYNGEYAITLPTAGLVAAAMGVQISELFEIVE